MGAATGTGDRGSDPAAPATSNLNTSPALFRPNTALRYTTGAAGSAARVAIAFARAQLGLPYQWGGDGPAHSDAGFDCSGLTHAAYAAAGISVPRTAQTQYDFGPRVAPWVNLAPGDLVFYGTPMHLHHVGLYIGGNQMINAPTFGRPVQIAGYRWAGDDYLGATRPAALPGHLVAATDPHPPAVQSPVSPAPGPGPWGNPTPAASSSPIPSPAPSPSATPTPTPTPTPTATPTPSGQPTPAPTPTPTVSPSPSPSCPAGTPSPDPSPSASPGPDPGCSPRPVSSPKMKAAAAAPDPGASPGRAANQAPSPLSGFVPLPILGIAFGASLLTSLLRRRRPCADAEAVRPLS
ncbi:MAG: C40 family peptidase [bacterium]